MYFNWRVVADARQRQTRFDEKGLNWIVCARCEKKMYPIGGYPVPIVPKELGGRATVINCAILCKECYLGIGKDRTDIIPDEELPFLNG
jgi:hypothetical protein